MAAFHEVRFPDSISRGSSGGPERRTDIVELRSGFEERNAIWKHSRRRYNAGIGLRNADDIYEVVAFWEARGGRLYGFRWKDWADFKSCGPVAQPILLSGNDTSNLQPLYSLTDEPPNSVSTQFQLRKQYNSGLFSYTREIRKPVTGTTRIWQKSVANVWTELTPITQFVVAPETGIVTFSAAPATGVELWTGFEFDVPVRFDKDELTVNVELFNLGQITDIGILEIRV